MMMDSADKYKGMAMALTAALLWGVSGTCAQFLFQHRQINTEWLVTVRLLSAGLILLLFSVTQKQRIFDIWKNVNDARAIVLFSLPGMLAVQYTYFAAIRHSNAATATILQYLGPAVIACYLAFQQKRVPQAREITAILLAITGTFLLVTHGNTHTLSISGAALGWGIASAFALAFYTLQPITLLSKYSSSVVIGWGMLLGGIAFSFVHAPWRVGGQWDTPAYLLLAFIIVFGSLAAFYLFLSSVKLLGATESSLLACAEPLSAAIIAVLWLKVQFGLYDWIGTALILVTILLLARKEKPSTQGSVAHGI